MRPDWQDGVAYQNGGWNRPSPTAWIITSAARSYLARRTRAIADVQREPVNHRTAPISASPITQ